MTASDTVASGVDYGSDLPESVYERVRARIPESVESEPVRAYHGPPGTGKTYQLRGDVRAEVRRGTPPSAIAATSFRVTMAESLAEAVVEEMGEGSPWLGTTHAICLKLIGEEREEVSVATDADRAEFCREFGISYQFDGADEVDPDSPFESASSSSRGSRGNVLFRALQVLKSRGAPYSDWLSVLPMKAADVEDAFGMSGGGSLPTGAEVRRFDRAWSAYKRAWGLVDFVDMLMVVVDEGLAPPVEVLIEDEFQDKTPLMVAVHNLWSRRAKRVYVAGDPHQAIYGFMGTSARFMRQALERADESVRLDTSYRNDEAVVAFGRRILQEGGQDPISVHGADDDSRVRVVDHAQYVDAIRENEERSTFHLFRCNYQMTAAAMALGEAGVPFVSKHGARWTPKQEDFYNAVAKAVRAMDGVTFGEQPDFSALTVPERDRLAESVYGDLWLVPKGEFPGFGESELALRDVVELRGLSEILSASNPMAGLSSSDVPLKSSMFSDEVNERLSRTWKNRGPVPIRSYDHEIRTIHGSKGLEADVVFLHDCTSYSAASASRYPHGEEARVWYVGATRTRGDLFVVRGSDPRQDLPV